MTAKVGWIVITKQVVHGEYDTDGGGNSDRARAARHDLRQQIVTMHLAAARMGEVVTEVLHCLEAQVATQEDLEVLSYWQLAVIGHLNRLSDPISEWRRVRLTQSRSTVKRGDIAVRKSTRPKRSPNT